MQRYEVAFVPREIRATRLKDYRGRSRCRAGVSGRYRNDWQSDLRAFHPRILHTP